MRGMLKVYVDDLPGATAALGAVWGTTIFGQVQTAGGFDAPNSQSQHEASLATQAFGRNAGDVVVLYSSRTLTMASPAFRSAVTSTLAALPHSQAGSYASYWSTGSRQFVSASGHQTYAVLELAGASDTARQDSYDAIKTQLSAPGLQTQVGGVVPTDETIDQQVTANITRAEALSFPLLLILLLVIFGSLIAACLPLAIGALGILGSFTALRLLTMVTGVSVFSPNITTILGLGLGIDYGLFLVTRFREELHKQSTVQDAVARTVATAGRTVLVSGITVTIVLASLMLFPETILRSIGYRQRQLVGTRATAPLLRPARPPRGRWACAKSSRRTRTRTSPHLAAPRPRSATQPGTRRVTSRKEHRNERGRHQIDDAGLPNQPPGHTVAGPAPANPSYRPRRGPGGRLRDEARRLPQRFPAKFRQIAWVVDEHGRLDADGREALFPLLGQGFHGLAEVGYSVAGGEAAADAPHHLHLVRVAVGGGQRGAQGLEFCGLRPAQRVEAVPVPDQPAQQGRMQPLAAEPQQRAARPVRFRFQVDVAEPVVHAVEAGGRVGVDLLPGRQMLVEQLAAAAERDAQGGVLVPAPAHGRDDDQTSLG